ncbi:MAG TPA: quinol:electron acceptor oxidoreductase subunit ActD, partial [Cyclobacteriaceae bacterium]|nr:quinol:electron acceptor oxidoreductase subunit ActD [Cyclobacteriaceae bacterium]
MDSNKYFICGVYDDEDVLLSAVEKVRDKGVRIQEVYSPFPVHGLDEALGYRRTRLPIAAFM